MLPYSGCSAFYCMTSLVFVPLKFGYWLFLKFARAPGLSGGRGEMAMAVASSARLAFFRGEVCASTLYTRCCPFVPCTATVHRAPGHHRWGVSETTLPVKTQGRTLDCPLNFRPPRIVAGWLLSVRRLAPGGQSPRYRRRNRTHCGLGGQGSLLQEWSAPLNGAVLGVRRHSKASDAMLEHCRDPLA